MKFPKTIVVTCWTALSACILLTPLESAWGPVLPVSDPISSFQTVGVDNFCRAISLWQQTDNPPVFNVQSSFLPQGGTWTPPVTIDTTEFPNHRLGPVPVIGVNPSGYAVGLFADFDNSSGNVTQKAATVQFGGSWSTPLLTSNSFNIVDGLNFLNVNANGYAVAYFAIISGTDTTFFSSTLAKGDPSWSTDLKVFTAEKFSFTSLLDQNNNAFVLFETLLQANSSSFQSTELPFNAGSWNPPLTIAPSIVFGSGNGAVDNAGNLISVFAVDNGNNTSTLQSSTLPAGATSWTAPLDIATNIVLPDPVVAPIVAVNPITGDAVVVFETVVGGETTLMSSSLPFRGSAWTTPITIPNAFPTSGPTVGIDYCGNTFVAWQELVNGILVIRASILPHLGNAWTTPVTISNPGTNSAFPFLATNGEGYTVVTWINVDENIVESSVWTPPATAIFSITPDCNDNNVTISGQGFCGVNSVTIGPVNATFDVVSANTIIATVPSGAGAPCSTVTVAVSSGCNAAFPATGQLTLAPLPPSKFVGRIKKEEHKKCALKKKKDKCDGHRKCAIEEVKKRKCTLKATWKPSPCSDVVSYNIYKGDKIIATIPANEKLEFNTKLRDCKAKGFSITAVDKFCQESAHVKLKIKD